MCIQKTFQKNKTRRPFSLIELIVCIAIVLMAGSLLAQKSHQLWKRHCFFRSVEKLVDELKLTNHFVQSMRADVDVKLVPTKKGIEFYRYYEEPGMLRMKRSFAKQITIPDIFIQKEKLLRFFGYGHRKYEKEITLDGVEKVTISLGSKNFGVKKIEK